MQRLGYIRVAYPHYFGDLPVSKTFSSEHETLTLLGRELPHGRMKPAEVLLMEDCLVRRGMGVEVQFAQLVPEGGVHGENVFPAFELVNRKIVSHPEDPGSNVMDCLSVLEVTEKFQESLLRYFFCLRRT